MTDPDMTSDKQHAMMNQDLRTYPFEQEDAMYKDISTFARFFFGLSLLLFIASCSETPKGVIKKQDAALNSTLDHLSAIGAKVSDQALSSDKLSLPANSPVLDLNDIGSYSYEGNANAQLFTVQDLLDPDAQSPVMHLLPSRMLWRTVKAMVKDAQFTETEKEALLALKRFSNWRYAVVIRARSVQAPEIQSQPVSRSVTDTSVFSTGTFIGGSIEGDVLLYDLDEMAFLGGFPISARSSANVESTTYGGGSGREGLQGQLRRDFTEQIKKAVLYGMIDRLPNDRIYMNGNLRSSVMNEKGK